MKKNLFNKFWLRVGMLVAVMTTALSGTAWAEDVTFNFSNLATANNWENGTAYTSVEISPVTLSAVGGGNNGKYYTSDSSWRMYTGGTVNITAASGYSITGVTSIPSQTFTISEGSASLSCTATIKFTSITVTYTTSGGGGDTPSPTEGTGTIDFGNGADQTAINNASVTGNDDLGNTWTITTAGTTSFTASSTYYQVGSGSKPATSITFTTTLASELNITAMSAKFGGFSGTAGTVTLKVGDTTVGTGSLNGTSDVTVASTSAAAGTVLTVTVTGIAKGVKCYYISYTCTSSSNPVCETPTFSLDEGTYTSAQNVTISTATEGATIYYTIDGSDPTTSSTQYSGAINVSSTTTIKAIATAEGYNNSPVASATYTIVPIVHAGTQADPYTVADARTAIDANVGTTDVYATGIVSKIVTAYNSTFGNISYNISADGSTTGDQLEAFRGFSYNGEWFTSEDDIQVGDVVVIYGNLTKYNSTYEFAANNQLVSLVRPPVISADNTVALTYNATSGEIVYSISNPVEGTNLEAAEKEDVDWITNVTVASDKVTFTTTVNTGSERTATITLTYGSVTMDVTVTQAEYVDTNTNTYTLATTITSGKHYIIVGTKEVSGETKYNAMAAQKSNNRGDAGVSVDEQTQTATAASNTGVCEFNIYGPDANGYYTIYDAKLGGYLYAASSSSNYLRTQGTNDDNGKWEITIDSETGVASVVAKGSNTRNVMQYNGSSSLFACYSTASQSPVYLYEKDGEATPTETVTITAAGAGYATYVTTNAVSIPASATAYIAESINESSLSLAQKTIIPAGTPVILKGSANTTYTLTSVTTPTTTVDDVTGNLLLASDGTVTGGTGIYALAKKGEPAVVGFYPVDESVTIPAGKAYLDLDNLSEVKAFYGFEEDDATSIQTIENGQLTTDGVIYNLAGQRLQKMQRGINIVNGKKILK